MADMIVVRNKLKPGKEDSVEKDDRGSSAGSGISRMSLDFWVMTFAKLSVKDKGSAARVCTVFRRAANVKSIWDGTRAVTVDLSRPPCPVIMANLTTRGRREVKVVKLNNGRHLSEVLGGVGDMFSVEILCANVTELMLTEALAVHTPDLQQFKISDGNNITDATIDLIVTTFPNLKCIELNRCPLVTDQAIRLIGKKLRYLIIVNIFNCDLITDACFRYLTDIVRKTPVPLGNHMITLRNCKQLTDAALKYIGSGRNKFTQVNLTPNNTMTSLSLAYLRDVRHLTLTSSCVTDEWLSHFADGTWATKYLFLCDVKQVTEVGLANIAHLCSLIQLLIDCHPTVGIPGLSDLTGFCSRLVQLELRQCPSITDESLERLAELYRLRKLILRRCDGFTFRGLNSLADSEFHITSLTLSDCQFLGPSTLRIVASGFLRLRYINLDKGYTSEQGIILAAKTLPALQSVLAGGRELIGDIRHLRRRAT